MAKTSSTFFGQWPENLPVIIASSAPNMISLGMVQPTTATAQLERLGVMICKKGMQPNVTMQVKAFRSSVLIGVSDIWTVSEIEEKFGSTPTFLGWIRFTFSPRLNLSTAAGTYLELHLSNYTYDSDNGWIGAVLDWPTTMGYNSVPASIPAAPVALELYGQAALR